MKYGLGLFLSLALFTTILGSSSVKAEGDTLLGDGCYKIPTTSTLVKVLVGAEEKDGSLVSVLTSGEVWVLKTFFSLTVIETLAQDDLDICIRTR